MGRGSGTHFVGVLVFLCVAELNSPNAMTSVLRYLPSMRFLTALEDRCSHCWAKVRV